MKVTVIFGSPRKNGNTASLLSHVLDELKKLDLTQEEMELITHKNALRILDIRNS